MKKEKEVDGHIKYKPFPVLYELCQKIAKEMDLPLNTVLDVVQSQFRFLHHTMKSLNPDDLSTYKTIRLHRLGTFKPSKAKLTRWKSYKEKKGENNV